MYLWESTPNKMVGKCLPIHFVLRVDWKESIIIEEYYPKCQFFQPCKNIWSFSCLQMELIIQSHFLVILDISHDSFCGALPILTEGKPLNQH